MNINKLSDYKQFEPSIELGQEKKTSNIEGNINKTGKETNKLIVNDGSSTNNAAKCSLTDQAKWLQQATDEISKDPTPIDLQKIASTIEKIRTGQLVILKSNIEERLASAEKLANLLLEN